MSHEFPGRRLFTGRGLAVGDTRVFPSSVTVSPQLTVMAVADYAAPGIE
jgi:choline dehydrogenase-like flavoprotein